MNPAVTAKGLRNLATRGNAQHRIETLSGFTLAGRRYPRPDAPEDLCVPAMGRTSIPADPLTAMELIDDACAFEAVASKLKSIRS